MPESYKAVWRVRRASGHVSRLWYAQDSRETTVTRVRSEFGAEPRGSEGHDGKIASCRTSQNENVNRKEKSKHQNTGIF